MRFKTCRMKVNIHMKSISIASTFKVALIKVKNMSAEFQ